MLLRLGHGIDDNTNTRLEARPLSAFAISYLRIIDGVIDHPSQNFNERGEHAEVLIFRYFIAPICL